MWNNLYLSVCLSPFSLRKGFRSLLKCVVGSHQASFLPREEEPFVVNNLSQRSFKRVPSPDLGFDFRGIDIRFFPHTDQIY